MQVDFRFLSFEICASSIIYILEINPPAITQIIDHTPKIISQANPDKYILKRRPEFRQWLQQLRDSGKYLYVITGSHFDFASHVASHAIGEDWKELFDIVIFFARKPSFFIEERPFWRLDGPKEIEAFAGWEDLETGDYYSQGNWKDMNEFFEYCTEWEPCSCLYFGDNVLQVIEMKYSNAQ